MIWFVLLSFRGFVIRLFATLILDIMLFCQFYFQILSYLYQLLSQLPFSPYHFYPRQKVFHLSLEPPCSHRLHQVSLLFYFQGLRLLKFTNLPLFLAISYIDWIHCQELHRGPFPNYKQYHFQLLQLYGRDPLKYFWYGYYSFQKIQLS